MPSRYGLKPRFENLLRPLANFLGLSGVTANQVTLAAMALSFVTGAAIFHFRSYRSLLLLLAALFLRMALDAIDGLLAREHHQKTAPWAKRTVPSFFWPSGIASRTQLAYRVPGPLCALARARVIGSDRV